MPASGCAHRLPETVHHPPPPPGLGPDRLVAWLAARQFGVVARRQLLAMGLTRHQIDGRIARGTVRILHRGVLLVAGTPLTHEARVIAALLSAEGPAVASHRSAAVLRGMLPERAGPVHVTVRADRPGTPGIVPHTSRRMVDVSSHLGIPCTADARTLVDVAATEGAVAARRAWTTLAGRRLLRPGAVERELRHHPGRRGCAAVRAMLEHHRELVTGRTRSLLEAAALSMCADHGLPAPRVNTLVRLEHATYEADLLWEEGRLIAELDDWSTHGHPHAFRADRVRDFDTELAGWSTIRLLWRDVTTDAERTAARIGRRLARGR
jgi:very-short-patch-repair endonuclease